MINIKQIKTQLEKEKKLLEKEMKEVGRKNPSNPNDWEPMENDINADTADVDEVADEMENFSENTSILNKLEPRYNDIKTALEKIKKGTYGKCEIGGEDIPEERLKVNPAAKTCIKHSQK
jgi:RNA polymerase-binding transcription factor DksA